MKQEWSTEKFTSGFAAAISSIPAGRLRLTPPNFMKKAAACSRVRAGIYRNLEKIMVSNRKNRIEIRGLSDQEIDYLKVLSRKNNFNSFNSFLVTMCREKIENGQFNQANNLYVAAIESMRETSQHTLELVEKQGRQISSLEESISNYAQYISRWLEYEGMVETDD